MFTSAACPYLTSGSSLLSLEIKPIKPNRFSKIGNVALPGTVHSSGCLKAKISVEKVFSPQVASWIWNEGWVYFIT